MTPRVCLAWLMVAAALILSGCETTDAQVAVTNTGHVPLYVEVFPGYWPATPSSGPALPRHSTTLLFRDRLDVGASRDPMAYRYSADKANLCVDRRGQSVIVYRVGNQRARAIYVRKVQRVQIAIDDTDGARVFDWNNRRIEPHLVSEGSVPDCFGKPTP
jgi:hypothetical protein